MNRTVSSSPRAANARALVEELQKSFANKLQAAAEDVGLDGTLAPVEWLRDEGRHGGGVRLCTAKTEMFASASINISHVHYDDDPNKRLSSATALSTIIHPRHPRAPSMHMHISWTEMRDGSGYWRVMGDLNPSHPNGDDTAAFNAAMAAAAPELFAEAKAQGERYFYIPALKRHRGVAHYYLENFKTESEEADRAFAKKFGEMTTSAYAAILSASLKDVAPPTADEKQAQLAYHTTYLFQVLTLDRGTTSGLMVHNQNDVGIMGSIPPRIDVELLAAWKTKAPAPQDQLVQALVDILKTAPAEGGPGVEVTDDVRAALAEAVRTHYRQHPDALSLQASGNVIPPTVDNHRSQ